MWFGSLFGTNPIDWWIINEDVIQTTNLETNF